MVLVPSMRFSEKDHRHASHTIYWQVGGHRVRGELTALLSKGFAIKDRCTEGQEERQSNWKVREKKRDREREKGTKKREILICNMWKSTHAHTYAKMLLRSSTSRISGLRGLCRNCFPSKICDNILEIKVTFTVTLAASFGCKACTGHSLLNKHLVLLQKCFYNHSSF